MDEPQSRAVPNDDRLVVHARDSFTEFFRGEYRQVVGLAYVLCGSRWAAEELTMEAFEAALKDWDRVSSLDAPGAWVRRVVSNASVSRYRRLRAERSARSRLESFERLEPLDRTPDNELWDAVRRLPRRQAQVVALFYVDGYQRVEIAHILGIADESVKTHLDRARRRLGEELGE